VNYGPRSILLHIYYHLLQAPFTFRNHYLLTANKYLFPHDTFNPLLSANRWDWQPYCKLGQSILVVLCAGSTLLQASVVRPAKSQFATTFRSGFLSPASRLNFGFITEGKLTAVWYVSNVSIIFYALRGFLSPAPWLFKREQPSEVVFFLLLHGCLCTICLVFCYTSWRFYAFSGTNLLTRCHSVSPCFLLFFCFRKVTREIFSELDETKAEVPIFPDMRRSPKQRRRGARGRPHPPMARAIPWPRRGMVWVPGPPPDIALPPIYSPRRENPKEPDQFSRKHTASRRHHRREIGRVQKHFPTPCRRGESPPEAFFITMPTSGVMCE
jgi:hypothetical protein